MLDLRVIVLSVTGLAGLAWATTPEPGPSGAAVEAHAPPPPAPMRFHCRVFTTSLDEAVDTRDRSTELGRWVIDMEARGWAVTSVDFEVGQKPTGFAEGFVQVCLTPVLTPAVRDSR